MTEPFLSAQESSLIQECIHCGLCLEACPTYRVLGKEADSPRGRLTLLRAVDEGLLPDADGAYYHLDRCLGCLACTAACPAGVQFGNILEHARATQRQTQPLSKIQLLALKVVTSHKWLAIVTWFMQLLQLMHLDRLLIKLPVLPKPLRRQLAGMPHLQSATAYQPGDLLAPFNNEDQPLGRVALFTGCVMDHWYRAVHEATIRVLRWNGFEVQIFAKQVCCGALHTHTGLVAEGSRMADSSLELAADAGLDAIVVDSAGCGQQLKEHRPLDASYGVYDVSEWLAPRLNRPPKMRLTQAVTYDPPCHLLYAQGVSDSPLRLLKASCSNLITAVDADMCCGSAGLYSVYQGELSAAVTDSKVANLIESKAELVVTGNPGCQLQLQAGLKMAHSSMQVMHIMEVLDKAYQLELGYGEDFRIGV